MFQNQDTPYHIVSLGAPSEFDKLSDHQLGRLRKGANDTKDLLAHHHRGIHEYAISDYLLNCNVLINVPKPKLHKKAGVTISLKNIVGTCAGKEYSPSHSEYYEFEELLKESVSFPAISNVEDYFMGYEYFYNTDLHLTNEGAILRTKQLIEDMRTYFDKAS